MALYNRENFLRMTVKETPKNPYPQSLINGADYGYEDKLYPKPTSPFRPYMDDGLDLSFDPHDFYDREDVTEYLVDKMINRLLTKQAVSLAEGKESFEDYGEGSFYAEDKVPEMYKYRSNTSQYLDDKAMPKKKQQSTKRQSNKKKKEKKESVQANGDLPLGSEKFYRADGTPMVSLSVNMMRQYMYTEVEGRVRHINEYYRRQWVSVNRERMQALADLIKSQEQLAELKEETTELKSSEKQFKEMCAALQEQLKNAKDAKKRKRQAKKQRKTESMNDLNKSKMDEDSFIDDKDGDVESKDSAEENSNNNNDEKKGTKERASFNEIGLI